MGQTSGSKAWDLASVREMSDVKAEYKREGKVAHFGRVFLVLQETCGTSSEHWKYKGRVVFQGSNVHTENNQFAVFSEQGTDASHHTSGKWLDLIARLPGCHGQDSDAVSAYTQAKLQGDDIWVELPPEVQPSDGSWRKFSRPVVRLRLALYGHPLAGLYWENHCRTALLKTGFEAVFAHECLYMH